MTMTNAILMASGLGTRMMPKTQNTPKPLLKIGQTPMIETIIEALSETDIQAIYIVVGYLKEQFAYLTQKYNQVYLIQNPDYATVNNISSVYYASHILKQGNCFICEADLYIRDKNIFQTKLQSSCYFAKAVEGYSDDWVFDVNKEGYITRVSIGGNNAWNMVGISYLQSADASCLADLIRNRYHTVDYKSLFWDEVVNENLDKLKLKIHPVKQGQIFEMDTPKDLENVTKSLGL